jgi:hypothetical protein
MRVTVALKDRADRVGAQRNDLLATILERADARVLRIFGRGEFASVEVPKSNLTQLEEQLSDVCVISVPLTAKPF